MSAADSSSNAGAPARRARHASAGLTSADTAPAYRRHEAVIDGLTAAVGSLRRGATALKAENHQLRAELAELQLADSGRRIGAASVGELGELAEIALPTGSGAPGAARMVAAHCLAGLVAPRVLHDTELLVSELVTNSMDHGQLDEHDTVMVRIYLAAETLRLEIGNAGTAGVVTANHSDRSAGKGGFGLELVELLTTRWGVDRSHGTTVWFEMGRT